VLRQQELPCEPNRGRLALRWARFRDCYWARLGAGSAARDCSFAQAEDVGGGKRFGKSLQRVLVDGFRFDVFLHFRKQSLRNEDLAARRLVREAGGEVRDRTEGCVVRASFETNLAARRIAEGDPDPEIEVVPSLPPVRHKLGHLLAQGASQSYSAQSRIENLDRIVEEDLDAVACEKADRRVVGLDEPPDRGVELAEDGQQLLRLDGICEARVAAQVAERGCPGARRTLG
jgi:hypothetical protein